MNLSKETAIAYLRQHPILPDLDSSEDTERILHEWTEVCEYFIENPCIEAIPLFISELAGGKSFEGFQYINDVISQLPAEEIEPLFIEALSSPSESVRMWVAEFAGTLESSNTVLFDALLGRVEDVDEDCEVRSNCACTIYLLVQRGLIDWRPYKERITALLNTENDEYIIDCITQMINGE